MNRLGSYSSLVIVGAALAACGLSLRNRVQDLTARSTFIFQGTVAEIGAAASFSIPESDSNVVITVEQVLYSPPSVGDFAGRRVTVRATGRDRLRVGQRAVFFATGWRLADDIAVIEVGRVPASDRVAPLVTEARQRVADQDLQVRVERALIIVVGRVSSVRPTELVPSLGVTEHDPNWTEAIVDIESVEKGNTGSTVTVLFPASRDVMWFQAPKFQVDDSGIWLLHKDQIEQFDIPAFTALDTLDFIPRSELNHVHSLIRRR